MRSFILFVLILLVTLYIFNENKSDNQTPKQALRATLTVFPEEDYAPSPLDGILPENELEKLTDTTTKSITNISQLRKTSDAVFEDESEEQLSDTASTETKVTKKTNTSTFKPLNEQWVKNPGRLVEDYSLSELRQYMKDEYNFQNLENKGLYDLRRIWLAYMYDKFFWDVHEITGFPVSVVYAYFIMEATKGGVESDLMANYMNPGGVKGHGSRKRAKAYDDCYDKKGRRIKCDFAIYESYEDMVKGWAQVLNAKRYQKCKSENNAQDICECLFSSGYHTGNNWRNRAELSKGYWQVRKSFPRF